ncbi:hypothetical protein [Salinibacillus xinjiangensis]|uniref:Uncharacterized protein n=1 Tax=Salinibacillus xinjiangensis TaxID=1229268 RepID=A0A6G1X898_9BACI|nr:hypothetical protein [Salinibacillus xinjiangensis]MRG87100.1 hypothetical protein [Salinibacillus xinjiangensis]
MGYVLPIRPFHYDTYHQRVIGNKQPAITLDKPQPIQNSVAFKQNYSTNYTPIKREKTKVVKFNMMSKEKQLEIFSEFTGKGLHINERI